MTAISAASGSTYQSPLQRLQDELQSEINSGAISSSDQDALSSRADGYRRLDASEPRHRSDERHAAIAGRDEVQAG
ncbi:hypothetical protein [Bradyrhizobium neotropicale]|uniref:hypothetical protein n=1 Tax=Bradyrhizobium neotropicale TaxID=1497615 RepID=UPI002896FE2F|nr:hypothetical protein [Bradyrhizobium neotropicale]